MALKFSTVYLHWKTKNCCHFQSFSSLYSILRCLIISLTLLACVGTQRLVASKLNFRRLHVVSIRNYKEIKTEITRYIHFPTLKLLSTSIYSWSSNALLRVHLTHHRLSEIHQIISLCHRKSSCPEKFLSLHLMMRMKTTSKWTAAFSTQTS